MNKVYSYNTLMVIMVAIAMILSGILLCLGLKDLDEIIHVGARVGAGLIFIATGIAVLAMKEEERQREISAHEKNLKINEWRSWDGKRAHTNPPNGHSVLVKDLYGRRFIAYYDNNTNKWLDSSDDEIQSLIMAWKELD